MATGPWHPMTAGAAPRSRLRASDDDRDQVIETLKAAFVAGLAHQGRARHARGRGAGVAYLR